MMEGDVASLTVTEAAHRLGIKPAKVRRYVSAHKLSARTVPTLSGAPGRAQIMLDADDVDALALTRTAKSRARKTAPIASPAALQTDADSARSFAAIAARYGEMAGARDAADVGGAKNAGEFAETPTGRAGSMDEPAVALSGQVEQQDARLIDPTGKHTVVLVLSMLAP